MAASSASDGTSAESEIIVPPRDGKHDSNPTGGPFPPWTRIVLGGIVALTIWVALLLMPSPLHSMGYMVAILGVLTILVSPQFGVYALVSLLIGQWPWNILRYLGLLTLVSSLAWLLIHQKRLLPRNVVLFFTVLFFLLVLASAIHPQTSVEILSQVLAYGGNCAVVWLLVAMVNCRKMMSMVIRLMVISGIVTAIIGLIQWRTHFIWISSTTFRALAYNQKAFNAEAGFELQQWRGQFRIDSITGTPDYLPLYMQILIPFVGLWVVRQKSWMRRFAGLGILGLFGIAHVLSFTRGALVTTAVVLFLLAWVIDRKRLFLYGPIVTLIGVMVMMSWGPWRERLVSMIDLSAPEASERVNTGAWRLRAIPVGIQIIFEHPFLGVGVGQGKWNWPESALGVLIPDPDIVEPMPFHNDYLGVGIEMGVAGLLVLLVMLLTTIYRLKSLADRFRLIGDPEFADIALALMIGIIGLAGAMTMYPLVNEFRYFWLVFGLAGALERIEKERLPQAV